MLIRIDIERRSIQLSNLEQNLATGAYARQALRSEFLRLISTKPPYSRGGSKIGDVRSERS